MKAIMKIDNKKYLTLNHFKFENGQTLENIQICYESWGELNAARDNAILVCHALTGTSHATSNGVKNHRGWWDFMIGPGRPFDTEKFFVICPNVLGGCSGTTGPSSMNSQTDQPYSITFPTVTVRDMVHAQKHLIDHLGIRKLFTISGASLGGMQALEWAALYPEIVESITPIATPGRAYPQSIAYRKAQRKAIMMDPDWSGGQYYGQKVPQKGIELARMIGFISYRTELEFAGRFGRNFADGEYLDIQGRFEIERYLEYHGSKLSHWFDANTYLYLSKAMDLHDLGYGFSSYEEGVQRITAPTLIIGFNSDILFPIYQQKEIAEILSKTNPYVHFKEIKTIFGHDAFLIEKEKTTEIIFEFLNTLNHKRRKLMKFQTKAIHAGIKPDPATGALITPIYQSTTFAFDDVGVNKGFDYSRTSNPTRKVLEDNLAALEGGLYCSALTTGLAAETTVCSLFQRGDHIICGNDVYGGTIRLFNYLQKQFQIEVSYVPMVNKDRVAAEVKPNTKAIWIETPSNPLFNVVDLSAMADIAHSKKLLSIVDNTLLSPFQQQPFKFGIDIVVHSTTKYLSGHNDGLGGAIICNYEEQAEKIAFSANALGTVSGAFDAWLILRGIKTLAIRMREHQKNAQQIARFLVKHPNVKKVYYPGLPDHPQAALIDRQTSGYGGMLSFELAGGLESANKVMKNTRLFYIAESFGGVESLIEHPQTMSHASMTPEAHKDAGITESLLRISVGLEDAQDLLEDLEQALVLT